MRFHVVLAFQPALTAKDTGQNNMQSHVLTANFKKENLEALQKQISENVRTQKETKIQKNNNESGVSNRSDVEFGPKEPSVLSKEKVV